MRRTAAGLTSSAKTFLSKQTAALGQQARFKHEVLNVYVNQYTRDLAATKTEVGAPPLPVVTVFGCTGFVGRYVVNALARSGAQVITPYHKLASDVRHLRVCGDVGQVINVPYHPADYRSIVNAVAHSNMVVCLVGRNYQRWNLDFNAINVDIPKAIALATKEVGIKKFVFMSNTNANAQSPSVFLRSKALAEQTIMDILPDATILRSTDAVGYEDRLSNFIAKCIRLLPGVPVLNRGSNLIQPINVMDIGAAVEALVHDASAAGKTYELGGPKVYKYRDFAEIISKIIHEELTILPLPAPVARLVGSVNEHFRQPAWTVDWVDRQLIDNVADPKALGMSELGLTPTPIEPILKDALARWNRYGVNRFMDVNFQEGK